jgi:hypothetical protein
MPLKAVRLVRNDSSIVKNYGNYRLEFVLTEVVSRKIALLKALCALANVTSRCDESSWCFSIHGDAVMGLPGARPDALCSSRVSLCVSERRIRRLTIMLPFPPPNECASSA